jgi:hypothetical protein
MHEENIAEYDGAIYITRGIEDDEEVSQFFAESGGGGYSEDNASPPIK